MAALCLATISRRLSFCTAVSMSFSGVHSSSIRMTLDDLGGHLELGELGGGAGLLDVLEHLVRVRARARARVRVGVRVRVSLTSLSTAASTSLFAHIAPTSSASTPSVAASALRLGTLGQMRAMA
eukprot:scaffold26677_cov59-Phaeocystis_antarctica.AAC.2